MSVTYNYKCDRCGRMGDPNASALPGWKELTDVRKPRSRVDLCPDCYDACARLHDAFIENKTIFYADGLRVEIGGADSVKSPTTEELGQDVIDEYYKEGPTHALRCSNGLVQAILKMSDHLHKGK